MKFLRLTIFMAHSMHIINLYPNIKYKENIFNRLSVYEIFKKRKNGSSEMSNVGSEHPIVLKSLKNSVGSFKISY